MSDSAPGAIKTTEFKSLMGRKVAIDASMSLYQFLIAVRQQDGQQLTNEFGETTSHLMGLFYRTLKIVENGIKPVYVFDGKPPELKSGELAKRLSRRDDAEKKIEEAKEAGNMEDVQRFERRTVKVTKEQNEEAKRLLKLMGIPYVEAPGEAEAQCAVLAAANKVYAAASEDMDTLTFATPHLLRHLTASDQKKNPVVEIDYGKILEGLELTQDQFIDLCILLGCDYCESIRGIGPTTAFKLIKEHQSLDKIVEHLQEKQGGKIQVPEDWPYEVVRELFKNPDASKADDVDLKWEAPDTEGLVEFLVKQKGFSEERVRSGAAKLLKGTKAGLQPRLTDFFKPSAAPASKTGSAVKRKAAESKKPVKRRK